MRQSMGSSSFKAGRQADRANLEFKIKGNMGKHKAYSCKQTNLNCVYVVLYLGLIIIR